MCEQIDNVSFCWYLATYKKCKTALLQLYLFNIFCYKLWGQCSIELTAACTVQDLVFGAASLLLCTYCE